jgi:hypothetical protein
MEQQQSPTPASPNPPSPPRSFARCQARNRSGSQCRLHSQDPSTGLCRRHALRASKTTDSLDDSLDLSDDILAVNDGCYATTDHITAILSNVVILVAKGRISARRAEVLTDALSLMLRSLIVMDRLVEYTPPQIPWDAPRPVRDNADRATAAQPDAAQPNAAQPGAAQPDAAPTRVTPPQTPHEAALNYARLRT